MTPAAAPARPRGLAAIFGWRRVRFTLLASAPLGLVLSLPSETATLIVVARAMLVGLAAMLAFGLFEQWPRQLPSWLARSALQLIGVAAAVPLGALLAYWITTGGDPKLGRDQKRAMGYAMLTFTGVLFAPWIAVGVMLKQRDAFVRDQALAFELEKSELERRALDARLRLLQAQVEPHFLLFHSLWRPASAGLCSAGRRTPRIPVSSVMTGSLHADQREPGFAERPRARRDSITDAYTDIR